MIETSLHWASRGQGLSLTLPVAGYVTAASSFPPWAAVPFKVSSSSRILVSLYTTNIIHTCYEHVQQHRNMKSQTNKKPSSSSSYHC